MSQRRFRKTRITLLVLLLAGLALAFRQGLIPATYSPLPSLDLATRPGFLVDWQLASLRRAPEVCRRMLTGPHIEATPIPDNELRNGCGWTNSVSLSSAGGARIPIDKISCETAAGFALWITHEVQPLAMSLFGQRVASVQNFGTYSCRNIVGNPFWKDARSEHATANALDIGGFTLADGRQISVLRDWRKGGPESEFLRGAHDRSCRYFRVSLGPDFNEAHRNHFHFDRGPLWTCR
jgi:hypothetical protein